MREYIVPIHDDSQNHDEIFVGYIRENATEIVRCFECKAFMLKAEKPRYTCYNPNGLTDPKPNDYCSHGERISE